MSLAHILLGVLRVPATGYDLKRWADIAFAHFWPADQSQIYRTLQRLESEGLVRARVAPSDIGPQRRLYRTTAAGQATLRHWLADGPDMGTPRYPWVGQVLNLGVIEESDRIAFLRRLREQFAGELEALRAARAAHAAAPPDRDIEHTFQGATIECGIAVTEARLAWVDSILRRLR